MVSFRCSCVVTPPHVLEYLVPIGHLTHLLLITPMTPCFSCVTRGLSPTVCGSTKVVTQHFLQAYYDMSGGMVTFHGKARVPSPATVMSELQYRNGSAPESSPAPFNTMNGYLTDKSYLDPDGVDVYGWAVLNDMRNTEGQCK
jgi:hypothetical protein